MMDWITPYAPAKIPEEEQKWKISVSVAIYKIEDLLPRCVESLLNQTYRNLEIILVDDGSPDGCPALCDEYAARDPRVRVIHKENGGLASVRNTGIRESTGEFIAFMDGDDWADEDMYERMMRALQEFGADMAVCRYRQIYTDHIVDLSKERALLLTGGEALTQYIRENDDIQIQNAGWNKLYRKDRIGEIRFDEHRWYEDIYYTTQLLTKMDSVIYLDHASHNYVCDRSGSYMNDGRESISTRILTDQIPIYLDRAAFLKGIGRQDLADTQNYFLYKRLLIYVTKTMRSKDPAAGEKLRALREIVMRERPNMDAAYRCPVANPNEKKKMDLYLRSEKLYGRFMDLNDGIIIPFKRKLHALRRGENA